jgi:protein-S-isoprenylcysteine O-methyltransferase Ste14
MGFLKALFAFLVLPGVAAFLVPLTIFLPHPPVTLDPLGFLPLLLGVALLLSTVREFYVAGRGTLAPWSPPEQLVTTGLYRFSRNPMYVAVVLVLVGWAAVLHSWPLLVYGLVLALAFHLRVVFGEEPWLARTHGDGWSRYERQVPRWFFRSTW